VEFLRILRVSKEEGWAKRSRREWSGVRETEGVNRAKERGSREKRGMEKSRERERKGRGRE
jgi:hypothetical protein